MTGDAFSPANLTATINAAIAAQQITIPDGHTEVFGTSYDGHQVEAFFAKKISDGWSFGGDVAWHGGTPSLGVQLHYSK